MIVNSRGLDSAGVPFWRAKSEWPCGELGRVVRDANADPAIVRGDIVHAVGRNLAQVFIRKVMHVYALRIALAPVVRAAVTKVANQLFFFVSTEMTGWPEACAAKTSALMYSN